MRAQADSYRDAVEAHGWDGEWYRRAYFDDGTSAGIRAERGVPDRFDRAELERHLGGGQPRRGQTWPCDRWKPISCARRSD